MQFPIAIETGRRHSGTEAIKQRLLDEIGKGVQVIARLDDEAYCGSNNFSSIGEQFRHDLDFLNTFLSGAAIGRIDYTRRERDVRVERGREYAIARFRDAMGKVSALSPAQVRSMVSVRSEIDDTVWMPSTVIREMEFVLSHTVHHHALIAEKLAYRGITLDMTLGVAPSTNAYWHRMAA